MSKVIMKLKIEIALPPTVLGATSDTYSDAAKEEIPIPPLINTVID